MKNMFQIYMSLINNLGLGIILALVLSKTKFFKSLILNRRIGAVEKIALCCIFGSLGIMATYTGVPVKGALANFRAIGVVVGGMLGGFWVGLGAGLLAGIHRWAIDIGGFTAVACAIATVLEGAIGGIAARYVKNSSYKWLKAFMVTVLSQMVQMAIILVVAKPFEQALDLVKLIALPMITINSIGSALFMLIIEGIFAEQQRIGASKAHLALRIANKTLPIMRNGFNEVTLEKVAKIILSMTGVAAVAFTDKSKILVHLGAGADHHKPNNNILTDATRKALQTRKYQVASNHSEVGCRHDGCRLNSAVIVPLFVRKEIIGTMKLYSEETNGIDEVDIELAQGLAHLFSTQMELSIIDEQARLLEKAELKALQAQINPHFLFNAINTIVSFCRTKPDEARSLLIHLGDFFRKNLNTIKDFVSLNDEIEHIKSYVAIEKARFGDKLKVEYDIGNIKCKIPPLTLQPLVENAIKHGLLGKAGGGIVKVSAFYHKDEIRILVEDNGIGIEEGKCKNLLKPEESNKGIALLNINSRLKNAFGNAYGLEIKSKPGYGTTVCVRVPAVKRSEVA
ncbi:MAG: two-component system, LytTR family, sensor histidine kinase LytS [Petroclostridium sp.]|uniref:sensor histidine kinase n=1 Tax=Petroclostridium xylanilyticum TaxID=1792311 RepID=UPI001FA8B937|nr:sensor histidine kinase [Petroclostridium xylanilyticum]MBZ4646391.1 histidine kinase [Clostridia bacterium]MDK2809642.1 two-component system, LytTR family, sensor histidine kinase LytS [Petroclostridium sp.]